MVELARIEKVDLREVWANEAADFTPLAAEEHRAAWRCPVDGSGDREGAAGAGGRLKPGVRGERPVLRVCCTARRRTPQRCLPAAHDAVRNRRRRALVGDDAGRHAAECCG